MIKLGLATIYVLISSKVGFLMWMIVEILFFHGPIRFFLDSVHVNRYNQSHWPCESSYSIFTWDLSLYPAVSGEEKRLFELPPVGWIARCGTSVLLYVSFSICTISIAPPLPKRKREENFFRAEKAGTSFADVRIFLKGGFRFPVVLALIQTF